MTTGELQVNKDWLIWARKKANISKTSLAHKMNVTEETVTYWEKTGRLDYNTLSKLAKIYNKSPVLFFSKDKPKYKNPYPDYRTLEKYNKGITGEILFELKNASYKRNKLLQLEKEHEDLKLRQQLIQDIKIEDKNKTIKSIKELLNYDNYKFLLFTFSDLVEIIESLGVLVFQFYNISLEDLRGFALNYNKLPIIGVNVKDFDKKFVLFNELSHLILNKPGLSNSTIYNLENINEMECFDLTFKLLLPKKVLKRKIKEIEPFTFNLETIHQLSNHYKLSCDIIIMRLFLLKIISEEEYLSLRETYNDYVKKKSNQIILVNSKDLNKAITKNGVYYLTTLLNLYNQNKIDELSLCKYLGIPLNLINDLNEKF
jgi:Zn-dependent peptidase ImmA (M78 family)/DNA-binding XRE family transcriptional regulator